MPKTALVPLAHGVEELEVVAFVDILRRGGVQVVMASVENKLEIRGRNGITLVADSFISGKLTGDWDILILPGGTDCVNTLAKLEEVLQLVRDFHRREKWIGAICAAPKILAEAGILSGKSITSHPAVRMDVESLSKEYTTEAVCIHPKLITSRGAGTALEFGFALLEILAGVPLADRVREAIVYFPSNS